jgi:hypothetical protein
VVQRAPHVPLRSTDEPWAIDRASGDDRAASDQLPPSVHAHFAQALTGADRQRNHSGCDDALDERPVDADDAGDATCRDERQRPAAVRGDGGRVDPITRDHVDRPIARDPPGE